MAVLLIACMLAGFLTRPAQGATLRVWYDVAARPIQPNDTVNVFIEMKDLQEKAAGFQAFLEFDDNQMLFIGGQYPPAPFGLAILPIVANGNEIDLAAGINTFAGQEETSSDAVIVTLTFQATQEFCTPTVVFRTHDPPTRLTDAAGDPILPLELISLQPSSCPADIFPLGGDGVVNVFDLLDLLARWNEPVPSPADFDCDGIVNVFDLLFLLNEWGPCN